ncbi:SEC-C domain-containing protein [Neorhizobium sp. LMR1-1-1.1]
MANRYPSIRPFRFERNMSCPCRSGIKTKKCCLRANDFIYKDPYC